VAGVVVVAAAVVEVGAVEAVEVVEAVGVVEAAGVVGEYCLLPESVKFAPPTENQDLSNYWQPQWPER